MIRGSCTTSHVDPRDAAPVLGERRELVLERAEHNVRMRGSLGDQRKTADQGVELLEAAADEVDRVMVLEQRLRVAQRLHDCAGVAAGDAVAQADLLPGQSPRAVGANLLVTPDLVACPCPYGHAQRLAGSAAVESLVEAKWLPRERDINGR